MNDTTELLDSLRDIREPLAPEGTSLLLLAGNVMLLVGIIALIVWLSHRRKNAWRRQALMQLKQSSEATPEQSMLQMARLLRQIMLHREQNCRHLTGTAYLQRLDNTFATQWFTQGQGKHFGNELYQPLDIGNNSIKEIRQQLKILIRALPQAQDTSGT